MKWIVDQISGSDGLMRIPFSSQKDSVPFPSSPPPPAAATTSGGVRISPTVLFVIVILAVIFFISGLLHLLIRFLTKRSHSSGGGTSSHPNGRYSPSSEAIQRQLQQLFHLHDSGLDQAFIDALPIFLYRELVGPKEPFDCAVCLCEFEDDDKLRLLPFCSHAFHLSCIDTWLLSNSTCPLCRGTLFIPGLAIENPVFDFDDMRDEEGAAGVDRDDGLSSFAGQKPVGLESGEEKMVLPVRLGKFRSLQQSNNEGVGESITLSSNNNVIASRALGREEGESSSSSLDARRCYSMGSYQYVVGDSVLQVALSSVGRNGDGVGSRRRTVVMGNSAAAIDEGGGRRLCVGGRGESFSVSKIWQWSNKKGKHPMVPSFDAASLDGGFPWISGGNGGGGSS